MYRVAFSILFSLFALLINNAYGMEIFADHANYKMEARKVVFQKNVKVLFDGATLVANNLDVQLLEDELKILSAIAYGSLKIYNSTEVATANKAVYNRNIQSLILHGNVVIVRNGVEIKADKYKFDINNNTSTFSTTPEGRVKVRIDNLEQDG